MAAEAFDVFGRGGPRQPNNIIKIKPRGARANSSPLLIGVSHRFRCMVGYSEVIQIGTCG
jgi:hypothetical protein